MKSHILGLVMFLALPGAALAQGPAAPAVTGAVLEQSNEYRFQLDLQVNQAALNKVLPTGWKSAAATQGAAKDCNLRLIFIDLVNIVGPDNRVLGKGADRAVYLEAPVRQTDGSATGRMILAGISENDPAAAGTFGMLAKASQITAARTIATANGITTVEENWDFAAASGEHAQLHVKYVRSPANRAAADVRFYNPADPTKFVLVRTEQETDITRNITTTPPDRVSEFSFKAGGGKFAALLDGTEKPLSWDSQPTYRRAIVQPN